MVSGARSAQGNRTRRGPAPTRVGERFDEPTCAVLGRHQVRLDAGATQRVGRRRPDGGDQHRPEGARVAQRAHEVLDRVDRRHHHPVVFAHRRRGRPQRGAPVGGVDLPGQGQLEGAGARPLAARPPGRPARSPPVSPRRFGRPADRRCVSAERRAPSAATGPTTMTAGGPRSTSARPASVVRVHLFGRRRPVRDHRHRRVGRPPALHQGRRRWPPWSSSP